jgi:hypothetical protein
LREVLQADAVEGDPAAGLNAGHESALIEVVLRGGVFAVIEKRGALAPAAQHDFGEPAAAAARRRPCPWCSRSGSSRCYRRGQSRLGFARWWLALAAAASVVIWRCASDRTQSDHQRGLCGVCCGCGGIGSVPHTRAAAEDLGLQLVLAPESAAYFAATAV